MDRQDRHKSTRIKKLVLSPPVVTGTVVANTCNSINTHVKLSYQCRSLPHDEPVDQCIYWRYYNGLFVLKVQQ